MINLKKIGQSFYEIPIEQKMRVKGYAFIDDMMAQSEETHQALIQLKNVAWIPGVQEFVVAMPDIHYGYGFPIGGVAATGVEDGVVSPGGVGYDINCGVRAIKTELLIKDVEERIDELVMQLYRTVPAGVGSKGEIRLSQKDEKKVVETGARWAMQHGFGEPDDLLFCEDNGCLEGSEVADISNEARKRGQDQLGTLGAGNHFLEIDYVKEIYDKDAARAYGLSEEQIVVLLHTGSRGFGYQICDDYLKQMRKESSFELPDPQLTSVYIGQPLGKRYISAMKGAANYAWANRQVLTHLIRKSFESVYRISYSKLGMGIIYDVSHNIARFEKHKVGGKEKTVCVHRKGATRAFPPNHPDLPEKYKEVGQPVLIPGDMGRSSYILKGGTESMKKSFGTTCHGAGRLLSRRRAMKESQDRNIKKELEKRGIVVLSKSPKTLREEMSDAYKDVSTIVDIVAQNDLAYKVAKLIPIGVVKG
ncbi:MAG: RtcB family protein [Spirochaetota bacterium]|nr:MAG: RtcB family protein [Spirochaetota bacterium]